MINDGAIVVDVIVLDGLGFLGRFFARVRFYFLVNFGIESTLLSFIGATFDVVEVVVGAIVLVVVIISVVVLVVAISVVVSSKVSVVVLGLSVLVVVELSSKIISLVDSSEDFSVTGSNFGKFLIVITFSSIKNSIFLVPSELSSISIISGILN